MRYQKIDEWVLSFAEEHNIETKDIAVDVFSQVMTINGKLGNVQITVIRDLNFEVVDVYINEEYVYTLYSPEELFFEDFKNKTIKETDNNYQ